MKDRQPGAPGQYKAVITPSELQKLQSGEQFVITMVRDDQPVVEGTPYNKASVLPDDLAGRICPAVTDPTPADALRNLLARRTDATLTVSGWEGSDAPFTQSILIDVLETETPHVSPVLPDRDDEADAIEVAFGCISKAKTRNGSILFICRYEKPDTDIPIQIEVLR